MIAGDLWLTDGQHLAGAHSLTVHIPANAECVILGDVSGSVSVEEGAHLRLAGTVSGSLHVASRARVTVEGQQSGSVHISPMGVLTVMSCGRIQGSLHNEGLMRLGGKFGGTQHGPGVLEMLPGGRIVPPTRTSKSGNTTVSIYEN